eukprot:1785494-Pyramimonas_sp.AAC.1
MHGLASIEHSSLTIEASDGSANMRSTTGAQIGFTTAHRDFNDVYNVAVQHWNNEEREHQDQTLNDTSNPIDGLTYDLSLSTAMDDVAKISLFEEDLEAEVIGQRLNNTTARLSQILGRGNWTLNPSKTNHLLCLMGKGNYKATRLLRRDTGKLLQGAGCREMRALGPYLPAEQGLAGEIMRRCQAGTKAWRMCG